MIDRNWLENLLKGSLVGGHPSVRRYELVALDVAALQGEVEIAPAIQDTDGNLLQMGGVSRGEEDRGGA